MTQVLEGHAAVAGARRGWALSEFGGTPRAFLRDSSPRETVRGAQTALRSE
jgi:hypothetical protein